MFDLVVKGGRLRDGRRVDVGVRGGVIAEIGEGLRGDVELDAGGGLVTESFANPHLHMCKVYTLEMIEDEAMKHYHGAGMGGAMTAIEIASKVKERYHESWIYENARKAALEALRHGCLHIRAFVDTDTRARLEGVKALLRLREELRGVVSIQVVAFPQDGVVRDEGAGELVRKAVEMGCDVVGGIPWIELTEEDAQTHIDQMFEIAVEHGKDVAMLVDDAGDPGLRTTEALAKKTIKTGWNGRVTACHARAMELYPDPYFRKLAKLLRRAGVSVVSDPHTGPLHARVRELLGEGVNVALGQDDIADAYYPYGRNKMLEVGFLASHLLWMTSRSDMETLYDMITWRAAEAMGVKGHRIEVGAPANLVVLPVKSVWEAFWYQPEPRYVVSGGRLVAENVEEYRLHL